MDGNGVKRARERREEEKQRQKWWQRRCTCCNPRQTGDPRLEEQIYRITRKDRDNIKQRKHCFFYTGQKLAKKRRKFENSKKYVNSHFLAALSYKNFVIYIKITK